MTLVNIDLRNQGYETGPDDRVVFYSLLVREGDFGTISTAPVEVPLVDGKATVDLAPGPVGVQIIAGQVADTRVKIGEVPPSGPTTLGAVMMVTPAYTPALQAQFIKAIQDAQAKALGLIDGEVAVAIDAEVGEFKDISVDALSRAKAAEGVSATADAKSTSATLAASAAVSTASNAVTRVAALEEREGLSPESPVDGQTANLIAQPETLTREAIDSAITDGAGILSVKSFGATGDGVTDDTAAIQAALDSVSLEKGITTVTIPDGVYMIQAVNSGDMSQWSSSNAPQNRWIGGGIHPRSGTTLVMAPGAVLKVIPNDSPAYSCIYMGVGQDDITIRGGNIEGDRGVHNFVPAGTASTHEWGFGISVRGATGITIDRVKITACTGDCILLGAQGLMNLPNSTYYPGRRIRITGCVLDGARRNNISGIGCTQVNIEGNTISRAGYHDGHYDGVAPRFGIDLEKYAENGVSYEAIEDVVIRGNVFRGNVASAVDNYNGSRVVIDGNHSDGPIGFGFGTDTVVTSNVIHNPERTSGSGISSLLFPEAWGRSYPAQATVVGNSVTGFSTGISIRRDDVVVQGNVVSGFHGTGIDVYSGKGVTVSGNRISKGAGADTTGLRAAGHSSDVTMNSNTIRDCHRAVMVDTSSTGIVISGNSITQSREGIMVRNGSAATIKNNTIHLPGHPAGQSNDIRWQGNCTILCEGNVMRGSSTASILSENTTGGTPRILGNSIIDSSSYTHISATSGKHEIAGNTMVSKVATAGLASVPIRLAGGTDKTLIMGNQAYHSGDVPISSLVGITAASNTKVVGNTAVTSSTSPVSGTDSGTLVSTNNTLVEP